jgi:hypothetical protein
VKARRGPRDEARRRLRADVQAGFDQLARGEAQPFDKVSGRELAERIKARRRAASAHTFVAGLASHRSVDPDSLVVRCALDDRERFLEDAPDTYYVTDYYRPYPVVLVRLSHLNRDALHDLLTVSRRMALEKVRRPARRQVGR